MGKCRQKVGGSANLAMQRFGGEPLNEPNKNSTFINLLMHVLESQNAEIEVKTSPKTGEKLCIHRSSDTCPSADHQIETAWTSEPRGRWTRGGCKAECRAPSKQRTREAQTVGSTKSTVVSEDPVGGRSTVDLESWRGQVLIESLGPWNLGVNRLELS